MKLKIVMAISGKVFQREKSLECLWRTREAYANLKKTSHLSHNKIKYTQHVLSLPTAIQTGLQENIS